MRVPFLRDRIFQLLLAALLLLPFLYAFSGAGSAGDVYGFSSEVSGAAVRAELFDALARSSWIGLGATLVALIFGLPAAWALSQRKTSLLMLALCALPLALAPSVAVSGWLHCFAPGFVKSSFASPMTGGPSWSPIFSPTGVALILGFGLWPIVAFEAWPAFRRARGEAYEAGLLAGSAWRSFFRVALPMARGELAAGALLVFLLAAGDFTVSSLLLVRSLPILVHDQLAQGRNAAAAWTALPLVLLTFITALVLLRVQRTVLEARGASAAGVQRAATSGSRAAWLAPLAGIVLGFGLPIAACFHGVLRGERSWGEIFGEGGDALLVSVRLAVAAALIAAVLGALRVACWPAARANALNAAGLLLLAAPGSFLAAGLLLLSVDAAGMLDHFGAAGEWLSSHLPAGLLLCGGYVLRFVYMPFRLAEEALVAMDPALLETAELAGHSQFSRGLNIALPQAWGHLAAAAALVFVLALGELPVSDKLAPPGAGTACVWLFQQQHLGYTEAVFGLSVMLGAVAVAGLLGAGGVLALLRRKPAVRWG